MGTLYEVTPGEGIDPIKLSTVDRLALTPPDGLIVYDTDLDKLFVYNGTLWVDLTASGSGPAGSGTLNYISKWTPDGVTLGNSLIQDDGTTLSIGTAPAGFTKLYHVANETYSFYSTNGNTTADSVSVFGSASGIKATPNTHYNAGGLFQARSSDHANYGIIGAAGSITPPTFSGEKYIGGYFMATAGDSLNYGVYVETIKDNTDDNVGIYINTANAGAGDHYIGKLIDGNEGAGQVLTSDAAGYASWATPTTGTVTDVTGTTPIASSGGTTPAISISAATTGAAGSMSAADKTKLDGISADADKYYSQPLIDTTGGSIDAPYGTPAILTSAANFYITVAETGTYIIYGSVNIDDDLNKDNDALELVYGIDPLGASSPAIGPVPYQQNGQHKKNKRNGIQGTWLGVSLNATDRVHMYMSTCDGPCTWLGGRIFIAQWK
jgi:hypothetical protein